jgi:hypothetical protein
MPPAGEVFTVEELARLIRITGADVFWRRGLGNSREAEQQIETTDKTMHHVELAERFESILYYAAGTFAGESVSPLKLGRNWFLLC